ncbi:MAG: hypothetical protein AB7L66_16110 [Gemmatimonadales bacterium]
MRAVMTMVAAGAVAGGLLMADAGEALAQKRQRDVITREELMASAQKNEDLFGAVRALRPHMLQKPRGVRTMGAAPPAAVALYVEGNRMGDIDAMKNIPTINVEEVRYLEPGKAQDQFGIEVSGGAVVIRMVQNQPNPKPPQ